MSDIRIDREGVWSYRGAEMSRQDIIQLFCRHLKQDASGQYFIEIGKQRFCVEVEDTPYVVRSVCRIDRGDVTEECLYICLSDGSIEQLDLETLSISKENVPYCRVKSSCFDARFSRPGYYQLAEHLEHDPKRNAYFIPLKGQRYYLSEV